MAAKKEKPPWWPPSPESMAAIEQISVWVRMTICLVFGAWGLHHETVAQFSEPQLIPVYAAIFAYPFWKWGDSKK